MDHADYQDRARESAADRAEDRSFGEIISNLESEHRDYPEMQAVLTVLRFAFMHLPKSKQESMREQLLDLGL